MPVYNKLVRDKIPSIIEGSGKSYKTRILSDEEYKTELQKKTNEEFLEYILAESDEEALEELADMLELIRALADIHGASFETLEKVREKKALGRGEFKEKIFLEEVEE